MKRRYRWQILLGIFLVLLSVLLYLIHFMVFRDLHHIGIYSIGDLAFLPIEVLLVVLIVHRLLQYHEKRAMLEKLNMVIGAFFSEVGTHLLTSFSDFDPGLDKIRSSLIVTDDWDEKAFKKVSRSLNNYDYKIDIHRVNLVDLKVFLLDKRNFLLRLLENPTLLEHESFTELMRAVFHLTEELDSREGFEGLPSSDLAHLKGDMERAYTLLVSEWVDYMGYLKDNYPYLFSLAMRTNPFDQDASPVVK